MIPPSLIANAATFLGKHWKLATGLIVVGGLVIALWLQSAATERQRVRADKALTALGAEQSRHAVTRQSVATLEGIIAAKNEEARRRAAEYEAAKADAAKDIATADARYAATEAKRAYLARLAAQTPGKPCPVPGGLLTALDGL